MTQPTQKLSGSLELKIDSWTKALADAQRQYNAWKASITAVNVPLINTGGLGGAGGLGGSGGTGAGSSRGLSQIQIDLASLRAEMAKGVLETKVFGQGYDQLAQTLSKVRSEAVALAKSQGATTREVESALKLALDATNNLGQITGATNGVQVQFQALTNEAKLLKAQLATVTPATAPADFQALQTKARDLAAALAALGPAAQGDAQALAALQQQINQLNNALGNAQNNLNSVNQGTNQQASTASKLTGLYGKLAAALAAVGFKEFAEFSRQAALDFAALSNQTVIFGKTLEANSIPISKGESLVEQLSIRFKTLPENIRSSVTDLVRAGASIDQVSILLNGAGASALAYGRDAKAGFEGVAQAVVSGSSAMLNQIGISENLGPSTDRYARSLGKTSEELNGFERAQAAANLIQQATVQENLLVEDSLRGLIGKQQEATNAAEKARIAYGKAIQPIVIETTKQYANLLQGIADFFAGGDTSQENSVARFTLLIKEQNEVIKFNQGLKRTGLNQFDIGSFLVNANADAQIALSREAIGKLEKALDQAGVAAVRAGERASAVPAKLAKAADVPVQITEKGLERIKRLQEQIEGTEVKVIPDTEARKIAEAKERFQDILDIITQLRKTDPGLSSQLTALEQRAKAVQNTEIATIQRDAAKKRAEEANQDAGVAAQAEQQATSARIAAMKDGSAKIRAEFAQRQSELRQNLERDLADVKGNEEATNRVRAAFVTERAAIRSQEIQALRQSALESGRVVIEAERALETARVGAMKEGSAKIRAQYQLEKQDLERQLAESLQSVTKGSQDEARVRAAFAGQLAALRIKTENEISALEQQKAVERTAKQRELNRSLIDQELKLATDRAALTGNKTEVEQARYTAQLNTLERFLNDQRTKYKDNADALTRINQLGQQQRELAEREHQKNLKAITDAGKVERVTTRTNAAITGVGDLDFAGIAKVRSELERLRRDSAGNEKAIKVVDDAFAKLNARAKTLKDQLKKVFEDIASNSSRLNTDLANLNDDPVAAEQRRFAALLTENKKFYDTQRKLALDNKDALLQINLAEAQDQASIAQIIIETRRKREKTIRDEIISGERDLAIETAKLRGDDDQARALQTEKDKQAATEKCQALIKLAGDNADLRAALERNLAGVIKNIDLQAAQDRSKAQDEALKRTQDYLKFLASSADEISKARATLNNDPVAGIDADANARKRGLIDQFADQIALRRKNGQDTVALEQQLADRLLIVDQESGKARFDVLKQQIRDRLEITRSIEDLRLATARAIASTTSNPFDDLKAQLASDLSALDRAQKDALSKEKLTADDRLEIQRLYQQQREAIITKAGQTESETRQKLVDDEKKRNDDLLKEETRAAKERADAAKKLASDILEANKTLQSGALDVLRSAAELTSNSFDDLAVQVKAELLAVNTALEDFLKRENLTDEQRTQAREIAANKRTLIVVNAARKQVQAEQDIVNAGLDELNFVRQVGDAVLTENQARVLRLETLKAEVVVRRSNIANLEREARVGTVSADQVRDAKKRLIQTELEYAGVLKSNIANLEAQAGQATEAVRALGAIGGVQKRSSIISETAATGFLSIAKALAEDADRADRTGSSIETLTKKVLAATGAFSQAEEAASGFLKPKYGDLKKIFDAGGEGTQAFQDNLERYALQISKFYNLAPDEAKRQLLAGLRQGFAEIDFSQAALRDSNLLTGSSEKLAQNVSSIPQQFQAISDQVAKLEAELARVNGQIRDGLNLDGVTGNIENATDKIIKTLESKYKPFTDQLGQGVANSFLAGFQDAIKRFPEIALPTLSVPVELIPKLAPLNPTGTAVGGNITNIYQIDGQTIANAPFNVREALNTLKTFAQQESRGQPVPNGG